MNTDPTTPATPRVDEETPTPLLESIRKKLKQADDWNLRTGGTQGVTLRLNFGDVVQLDEELKHRDAQLTTATADLATANAALAEADQRYNYACAEKDKWGQYWHDLAQERIVALRSAESALADTQRELKEAQALHRMQLAAVMTASIQNTDKSKADRIDRDNPFWTVAYNDMCIAVDREMRERARADEAERKLVSAEQRLAETAYRLACRNAELKEAKAKLENQKSFFDAYAKSLDGLLTNAEQCAIPGAGMDGLRDKRNIRAIADALKARAESAEQQLAARTAELRAAEERVKALEGLAETWTKEAAFLNGHPLGILGTTHHRSEVAECDRGAAMAYAKCAKALRAQPPAETKETT